MSPASTTDSPSLEPRAAAPPTAPLRVLHLFGWFRPEFTGEGRYVESIAPLLAAHGLVNDVAVTATRAPATPPSLPGIRAVRYFGHGFRGTGQPNLALLWWLLRHVRDYDVIHLHAQIDRYFLAQFIARLAGRRVIQSCTLADGMGSLLDSYRSAWRFIPRLLIGCIDQVVAISLALRDDNLRVLPPDRVVLIPQGVRLPPDRASSTAARAAARARWGIGEQDCVLLFVGGLCARKGVRTLVDAMPALHAALPQLRLLIVGPDLEPDYAAALRAAAAPMGDAVIFAGFQENTAEFYQLADMLVFASYQEGFSNVLLESLAAGLPVICRRLPGGTDWILDGGALGLQFDDDAEYPALVRALATDPARRASLAAAGRRKVAEQFEMGSVAARYASLYRGIPPDQAPAPTPARAPRRVLHLFGWFHPEFTGEGRYVEAIAPLLAAHGLVNDVAVTATRAPATPPSLPGIRTVRYFGHGFRGTGRPNLALLWWLLRHVRDYDVIHLHAQIDRYFLAPLLARVTGRRVIQSCTLADGLGNVVDSYRRAQPWVRRMLRATIDAAVTISPALHDDSLRVLPPSRVALIPQGVFIPPNDPADHPGDPTARTAARTRWGLGEQDCVLLFVGGLCARKGVRTLVDAMPALRAALPQLRLLIVGPDLEPDYAAALRAAAAPMGDAVIFAGFQERPAAFYGLADLFVFASHQEGFGNVLLEAMAARLPIICRRLPGVTDWILDNGALGLLFDDDAEYPALVRTLATDPARRASLAAAARTALEQRFDMQTVAARYALLYEGSAHTQHNG